MIPLSVELTIPWRGPPRNKDAFFGILEKRFSDLSNWKGLVLSFSIEIALGEVEEIQLRLSEVNDCNIIQGSVIHVLVFAA